MINAHFIKKQENSEFTILCPSCFGGCIYNRLEQQFQSPTINCFMKMQDFVQFCIHLDYYLAQELRFIQNVHNYLVGRLEGSDTIPAITIHFNHDEHEENARSDWNRRKARINQNNLYIILYQLDDITIKEIKLLDQCRCNNKVLLSSEPVPEISWSYHIEPNLRSPYSFAYLGKDLFGLRDYEKKYAFVGFLNKK